MDDTLPLFQITCRFYFSTYIPSVMQLNIYLLQKIPNKRNVSRNNQNDK
jgi:hypothetical protein